MNKKVNIKPNQTFTPKQRKFFEYIAQGYTRTEAAKKAGYKQPRNSAASNVQNYTQAFREAFSILGYTIGDVAKDLLDGTKAMRVISAVHTDQEASGASCDFVDVPDWNARHKFIDSTIKVQGFMASEKHEVTGEGGGPVEVLFRDRTPDKT